MSDHRSAGTALTVDNVTKTFRIHHERASSLKQYIAAGGRNRYEEFVALRNVSFSVDQGEAVGIIGHNGSGKSTLLKCMAKIYTPNEGRIDVHKKMAALLELGAGFHHELSGRDNVFLNASILGMGRKEIAARFDEIVEFSGLGDFIDSPVKTYSSGMYVRLAFAVAINVDPELLLIDEILAVGDVAFQKKCMEKFVDFRTQGRTLVLVTHDPYTVREFCDRAIWLDHGVVRRDGDPADVVDEYTETMLGAETTDGAESSRRGDGRIKVTRTELLVGGVPVDRFRNGDDVTIRLHWEAEQPVAKPVFSVTIASLAGATLTAPSTRDVDMVPDSLVGSGHVDVRFDAIPLVASQYVLHTEITGWGRQHVYDHVQNAQTFDVIAGDTKEIYGLVTLHPTWSGFDE
ncbi:MAG: ABC transporter ATP-binding protein [Ilumatobacter sp.]|uniref:ABC transporter ATP-binding protein n=1 Tax=Ilumatobacter sp. TaxID=1967498 RepID=UPI001D5CD21A|nr:ABC transporter ATP-binding protein [Ilumatobacter sp.]MBT5275300.1 ABC transporter ATP-binding protein [Ilumatobacter sp.]MBT5554998.1 ABC transporter ATP-binding protein [Ilumatobacter sp.]MBT5866355.1 ABC transporter ATP-binding protein [Ilumatobacter sp.]MDG0977823.1 ABC transporter ATP-binding protein [Ilumatobacter sp.]